MEYLRTLKDWLVREEGQDVAEYGLLAVLIAVVAAVGVTVLGIEIDLLYQNIVSQLPF